MTIHTVMYSVHIRFWPTLLMSNPAFDVAGVHPAMELQEERGARESLWQAGLFIRVPLVCALCIPRQCDFVGSGL
jgi:hypothetical protein